MYFNPLTRKIWTASIISLEYTRDGKKLASLDLKRGEIHLIDWTKG